MKRGPNGVTLVEVLISLLLGMAVVSMGWRLLARQSTVAAKLVHRMEVLAARRVTAIVLGRELRAGVSGRDWAAPEGDSLAIRAFRGWALICGEGPGSGMLIVSFRGGRAPNPVKDSLLLLTASGWRRANLVDRKPSTHPCRQDDEGGAELWMIDPPISGGLVARLFERGSYHVSGGALRYRRGFGGRQPLTAAVFDDEGSSMGGSEIRIRLELIDGESLKAEDSAVLVLWAGEAASRGGGDGDG